MSESACNSKPQIQVGNITLEGILNIPSNAKGLIVFVHGSGSSRFSSRNQYVADFLNEGGLATLLFDLLTADEHSFDMQTRELRFNINLLSRRLIGVLDWLGEQSHTSTIPIGLFGASTGAAAALIAAAARPDKVITVVARGGRPDLAGDALVKVKVPTLFIVGGLDEQVIQLNRLASHNMQLKPHMEIVPGATHLFEEPGKLEHVAQLTRDWFLQCFFALIRGKN